MQQWPKHSTHFARKLPQVKEHEKPHSLHQDYQYVMQLQLCCFLLPKGSRSITSICGAWMSRLLASRLNAQSVTVQLTLLFPMHSSHSSWMYTGKQQKNLCPSQFLAIRNITATVQCMIYLQSSQDAVLSASQLLTFLCWCHRPPLGNPLVSC